MVSKLTQPLTSAATCSMPDPATLNQWYPLARSQDLPVGSLLAVRLLETDLLLWRDASERVHAWEDRCPHRSVRLSIGQVVDDQIICAYHGLAFDATGQCVYVPAYPDYIPPKQACVRTYTVQEKYDLIYGSLGKPIDNIPEFQEWTDPSFRLCLCGPYYAETGGLRAIENFLDVSHFPFVHPGSLGDPSKTTLEDYEALIDEQGVWLRDVRVWQPDPDGCGQGSYVTYNYWAYHPLTAYLKKETAEGNCLSILFHVTPVSETESIGWMWIGMNYAYDLAEEEVRGFQDKLIREDFAKLEAHNPKQLPLDLQAEFHLPCDRGSLMYRKWLKQLGVTYGTV